MFNQFDDFDFEAEDFNYFQNTIDQIQADALHFGAPIQDLMREDVMRMRQAYPQNVKAALGATASSVTGASVYDRYSPMSAEFEAQGVAVPQSMGDVQRLLLRSMYPSFIEIARQQEMTHRGSDVLTNLSDASAGYLEGLGEYAPTTSTEPLRGTKSAFWRGRELAAAFEATGAPKGSFGYNDDQPTLGSGVASGEDLYGGGGYISEEANAQAFVGKYQRDYATDKAGRFNPQKFSEIINYTQNRFSQVGSYTALASGIPGWEAASRSRMPHEYIGGKPYGETWDWEVGSTTMEIEEARTPYVTGKGVKPTQFDMLRSGSPAKMLGSGMGQHVYEAQTPLTESPYFRSRYDTMAFLSQEFGGQAETRITPAHVNWQIQQTAARQMVNKFGLQPGLVGDVRGKTFDPVYDQAQQSTYKQLGQGPDLTSMFPRTSVHGPMYEDRAGNIKPRWSPAEYNFGLTPNYQQQAQMDAELKQTIRQGGRQLPPYAGYGTGPRDFIEGQWSDNSAPPANSIVEQLPFGGQPRRQRLLGAGGGHLLPQGTLPPVSPTQQMPAQQAGAGMPFAMGRGVNATYTDSWYAGDQQYHEPMISDRGQWEMSQRDAVQQSSLQRNSIMPMPLLPPGGRGRSEEIIPGENQYYEDRGASQHPSATPISQGTPLLPASTGSRESQFYGGLHTGPSEYALNRMGPIGLGARAGALGGRDRLSSSTDIVPYAGRQSPDYSLSQYEPDPVEGDPGISSATAQRHHQSPGVQGVLDSLKAGRSAMGSLRPGYGKTEAIVGAAHIGGPKSPGGGVSISMSPLTSLNIQTTGELNKRNIRAFNLIGHPGEGQDDTAWAKVHKDFRDAVTESIDPKTGEWIKGKSPVVGVMSFEKYGALDEKRGLGKALVGLHDRGLMGPTTIDEAQEFGRGGRLMVKRIADVAKSLFPKSPTSLLGGTITRSQEGMLQNLFGIEGKDIQRAPASMQHLDVGLEAVSQSDYEATGGRYAREARGGQLQYGYSTKLVDKLQIASQQEGREAFRYHKGFGMSGELIPQAELEKVEKLVEGGLTKNQTVAASPALGLGMNIEGTESVTQIGAARPSDIVQRALRIRPGRLPSGEQDLTKNVGEFRMAVDPKQYENFAQRAITNTEAMKAPELARAYQAMVGGGDWSKNWREASQQIDTRLGKALEQQTGLRGMQYAGGEASRILQEAGLLELETVQGPRGSTYQNWVAKDTNLNPNELARKISDASYTSEFDHTRKNMSFRDFRSEQADVASRELRAMGSIVEQTKGMSPGGAGKVLTKGLNQWLSAGGKENPTRYDSLNALEDFAETEVPKQISDKYVASVEAATKMMNEQVASGTSMSDAMKTFSAKVDTAAAEMSGSPQAAAIGAQTLDAMGIAGGGGGADVPRSPTQQAFANAAQRAWSVAQTPAGGAPPPTSRGGLKNMGAMGGALYGAYLGSRFWRMFAEPSLQAMKEYGAVEAEMQPLMSDFGGELTGAAAQAGQAEQVKMNLGRGAWQLLEPVTGGMYKATQSPAVSRGIAGVGIGAGLAAGGTIASMTLGGSAAMMKMAGIAGAGKLASLAGLAAPFGLYAGAAALGAYGIREGMIAHEEYGSFLEEHPEYEMKYDEHPWVKATNDPNYDSWEESRWGEAGGEKHKKYKEDMALWRKNRDATSLAQQIAEDSGFLGEIGEIIPLIGSIQNASGQDMVVGNELYAQAVATVSQAADEGMEPGSLYSGGAEYAAAYGATIGTTNFNQIAQTYAAKTPTGRMQADKEVAITNQYASQLAPWIGMKAARGVVRKFGIDDQAAAGRATGILSEYTTRFGKPMRPMQSITMGLATNYNVRDTVGEDKLVALTEGMSTQGQAFVQGLTGQLADAGVVQTGGQYYETAKGIRDATSGFSNSQFALGSAIAGGDMQAQSFAAWNDPMVLEAMGLPTGAASKMYGQTGMPNYMTSGRDFMLWGQSLIGSGLKGAEGFNNLIGQRISEAGAQDFLGVSNPELAAEWYNNGNEGAAHMLKMEGFANARAGVGNAMAKITAQERFLWGGGAWTGTPAEGSMWYLQDKMTALQHSSQMAEFAYSTDRMETSNEFAIRGEAIQGTRMAAGHAMQRWQTGFRADSMGLTRQWGREDRGFQAEGMALQRQWGREDWAYQDQSRALDWEWGMEDMNEAIRMSSGRDRKQLIKQRDRMAITHGREEEQIDKVRERQEEMWGREEEMFDTRAERQETLWSREEEQFEKQTEYSELLMGLDQEQYDLNVESRETLYEMDKENQERRISDYEKQHKLQEEITKLQRDHQAEQLELSKAALGLQAQAIQNQEDQYLLALATEPVFDKIEDELGLIAKYGKVANIFYSFRTMAEAMNNVNASNINKVTKFLNALK